MDPQYGYEIINRGIFLGLFLRLVGSARRVCTNASLSAELNLMQAKAIQWKENVVGPDVMAHTFK